MKQHKDILIKRAFEKSDEALRSAEKSLNDGFLSTAQNRVYYAIFYAVTALGYFYEYTTTKHQKLFGWFNKKFIYEEKIFDRTLLKIYKEALENRQKSDYEFNWKPVKENIARDIVDSKVFIEEIKKYLSNQADKNLFL